MCRISRSPHLYKGDLHQHFSLEKKRLSFEADRSDTRTGTHRRRHVDHWRPVHRLLEPGVWEMLRRHGIVPAPAYRLGWSRLSCLACIFGGSDQWASVRYLAPAWFEQIAAHEEGFGRTIQRHCSVRVLADRGRPYRALVDQPELAQRAMQHVWDEPVSVCPKLWTLPAGAFGEGTGPS